LLEAENLDLQAAKAVIEAELDKNIDETLVMLGESFDQALWQTHLLYGNPPPSGSFDVEMDVYDG